ncbi:MAG TPA: FliI/YscN family ATPase [Pirellulales bacterium]|jgi:flagellum-specific ATP synthase|nr:FliI/YscN family ATPase [Pirellulales bacterium]
MFDLADQIDSILPTAIEGRVLRTSGTTIAAGDFPAPLGAQVEIARHGDEPLCGEVVGFDRDETLLAPLGTLAGVQHGQRVRMTRTQSSVRVGPSLLGRVVNAHGTPIDRGPAPLLERRTPLDRQAPSPVDRPAIDEPLSTGIRAIDALLTCGRGQRMGIFSGSGVGKSVLMGLMARNSSADVNVIGLIGERGREVNEFIERDLGPEGLARSVIVVATSDEPALVRTRAAMTATAIAESFRDEGRDVLLMMDSLTRFALAQREIGLAAGEPPATRAFPPSVFAALPKLVERAGRAPAGSITAFYSVLVESDDANEPIADAVRGLLDGHVWLSRRLASRSHYPAIDILESVSRLMHRITTAEHRQAAATLRELLAALRDHEDLINVGAYRPGSHAMLDVAMKMRDWVDAFLRQDMNESSSLDAAKAALAELHHTAIETRENLTTRRS